MWTCTICSLKMVVDDGPSHLASGEHIALLSDFHARVLKSHLEELAFVYSTPNEQSTSFLPVPVECQGLRHVIAEESTPTGLWSYPNVASSTIPKKVKPAPLTPIKLNPAEATLWTCKVCDRAMHEGSKSAHLAGKAHAKKLKSDSSVLLDHPHVSSTKPMAPETKTWTCPSCKAVCLIREKMYHRCARSMFKASTVDGPLDEFFSFYPSFHYDPSVPPATSFRLLQSHLQQRNRWARESPENDETWYGYQAALIEEFNLLFGIKDNLDAWQCLCRAVRISPLPTTIALCRSVSFLTGSFL